jgi:hypothetical protein
MNAWILHHPPFRLHSKNLQKIYNYLQLSAAPSAVEIGIVRSLLHP